jgi:putative membrane protein
MTGLPHTTEPDVGVVPERTRRRRWNPLARPGWLDEGEDPDYRFTLANERTFLAWLRTSLALLAGAVAVAQIIPPFTVPGARTGLAALLTLLGLAVAASAYRRWARNEQAMRHRRSLPHTPAFAIFAVALCTVALVILVLVVLAAG